MNLKNLDYLLMGVGTLFVVVISTADMMTQFQPTWMTKLLYVSGVIFLLTGVYLYSRDRVV